jgi:hypothetical protein
VFAPPIEGHSQSPEIGRLLATISIMEVLVGIPTSRFWLSLRGAIGAYCRKRDTTTEDRLGLGTTRQKRRSERVKLSVPVLVMTETLEHKPAQEVTQTIAVNAHGGLFKLKMEVLAGQPMVLVNMQTNLEKRCRVVLVKHLPAAELGVAFEFAIPAPEFWSMKLPPADWNAVPSES